MDHKRVHTSHYRHGRDATYENGRLFDPDRVYLDIANSKLSRDLANRNYSIKDEMLKQIRIAQSRPDMVRVVLDVSNKTAFSISELHNPFRIVIDLHIQLKQIEAPPDLKSLPSKLL